jgi:hypothetical protein
MGARGSLIAGGLVLFLALAGGAAFVTGVVHLPRNCEGPRPNWDNPGGVQVAALIWPSLQWSPEPSAQQPSSSSKGTTRPEREDPVLGVSAARVRDVPVEESVPEVTQAWIDSRTNNPTGCSEDSVVTLQSRTRAALSVGRVTSIMWLDHGLLIDVLGTFSKVQALEVANQV